MVEFGASTSAAMLLFIGCCTGSNTIRSGGVAYALCTFGGSSRTLGFVLVAWAACIAMAVSCYGTWCQANGGGNAAAPHHQQQHGGSGGGGGETVEMMNNPLAAPGGSVSINGQQQQLPRLPRVVAGPADTARCPKCNAKTQFCMCGTKRTSLGPKAMMIPYGDPALKCGYKAGDCNAFQTKSPGPYCSSHSCPICGSQKRHAQKCCSSCDANNSEA